MSNDTQSGSRAPSPGPPRGPGGAPATLLITTAAGLEGEARQELRRLLPGAEARTLMLKGNIIARTDLSEEEAVAILGEAETRLVARVTPVQGRVSVARLPSATAMAAEGLATSPESACFPAVAAAAADIGRLAPRQTFLVRCQRRGQHQWTGRDLERAVAAMLEEATGAVGEYETATDWLVSIEVFQDIAYVGINRPAAVLHKQLRAQRKYPPGERPLNRAEWKLKEALTAFGIDLPAGARVLDLGSAPGGWAKVLAELGAQVVAVDPADLDPAVEALPNVQHLRLRAEELIARHDLAGAFDVMTCDMNVDPEEAAAVMCALARLLEPGAVAIMTVKYTTRFRRRHEQAAREALSAEYEDIHMRRLPHNALETTAVMRRKGGAAAAPN
jgi:tRNA(Ser,Leu) C12 N-acetylase TAN1